MPLRWVATCPRGLEEILVAELASLAQPVLRTDTGGGVFEGDWEAGLRALWRLRSANRLVLELAEWSAPDDGALYRGARTVVERASTAGPLPLEELFSPDSTLAIQATSTGSGIRDTQWIAMKVKDAIVDVQRERWGRRSDVDRREPDVALRLRLHRDRAALLLDFASEPLDRRGYRRVSTAAPLRENLAAACLLASGWNGRGPVVDPMCGSGTFLAEAGAIALGLAPNRLRESWGFHRPPGFDTAAWDRVRAEPIPAPDPAVRLYGVDLAGEAMVASRRNLEAAGLLPHVELVAGDAFEFEPPPGPGLVVVNPPHGSRMLDSAESWKRLGDLLKKRYPGWKAVVFAGGESRGKHLGLKPTRRIPAWNGPLEARILIFDLW